jgi:uncharacterized protein YcbK (DUF882 family)
LAAKESETQFATKESKTQSANKESKTTNLQSKQKKNFKPPKKMNLSKHFTTAEFEHSNTAQANHINNTIPEALLPNLENLCEQVLEPLRAHVQEPITISSGYRSPELNHAVGGAKNSQHTAGEAADIYTDDIQKLRDWYRYIQQHCPYDQLLWEKASGASLHPWIHVSLKRDPSLNRHQSFSLTKHK